MARYFIEVAYKGTAFSGFQVQENANSIQAEVEKALQVYFRRPFLLTGSSRTDAGVHALQNFFHFDTELEMPDESYHMNAILPADIVMKRIFGVADDAHCRFDAISREYHYHLYSKKDPFKKDIAYYYPYELDLGQMNAASKLVLDNRDFSAFAKRNSQVKTFECSILDSEWAVENGDLIYRVKANRFLRGMVKGLVGTMLQVGRKKLSLEQFKTILGSGDSSQADFSPPSQGLFLVRVNYPE